MQGESFEQLVARVQGTAFFVIEDTPNRAPRGTGKKHRLVKRAGSLSPHQQRLLIALLKGEGVLTTIEGHSYCLLPSSLGTTVCPTAEDAEYTVAGNQCTCPDSKFRGNVCKHIQAVNRVKNL